jgi:4-hydroxymandelate oxidase
MTAPAAQPVNLFDVERLARARLDPGAADYIAGGAEDEVTLHRNREALERIALRPRCLVDVDPCDPGSTVLGAAVSLPVLIAPTGFQMLADPEGERATARAAERIGTVMVLSTFATVSLEEVRSAASGPRWFQLYVHRDRGLTRNLIERAERVGYAALVLTVDVPVLGRRERDLRSGFTLPLEMRVANFDLAQSEPLHAPEGDSGLSAFHRGLRNPAFTWKDLDWLASVTTCPIVLKGLLRADDARRALDHGVRGVIVSNHGGRQLDGAVAAIHALPEVAEATDGRAEVLLDGGIRRGTDVIKALALGARAVLLGRPVLWGLAWRGEEGIVRVFQMLREELEIAMALCGAPSVRAITADLVVANR